jgi:glycosyltransferase involved in cell wall biosynthesis
MRILCMYFHYASPDCPSGARAYPLLRALGQRHEVTVLTGTHYFRNRLTSRYPWEPPGVTVRKLSVPYSNQMGVLQRLRGYVGFPLRALVAALRLPRPDVIYGISTPLTTAAAAATAARWHGVPWVFEVRDLWPDFPIEMGALPFRWLRTSLRRLERFLYRDANHVITVSPDMSRHVEACGVPSERVTTLLQGTDLHLLDASSTMSPTVLRQRHGLGDRHVVLYAGTLGRANDLTTVLAAAQYLLQRRDVTFVIVGQGHHAPDVDAAARRYRNVIRIPTQPRHRMMPWFQLASLTLVPFLDRPVLATNAPTKLFDSLAAGTPVLVTNPGWTAALVRATRCGWVVPPSDPRAMAAAISHALDHPDERNASGARGAERARAEFDRRAQVTLLERILRSASARRPASA